MHLIQVLDDGITRMNEGQDKLDMSSSNFNNMIGKLSTLSSRFANELNTKSSYFDFI